MKYVLASGNVDLLAQLAWSQVLLAFDFDGTLAPIVRDRDRAQMRPRTRRLFARICDSYPCAVISGRSHSDVSGRLGGASPRFIVGNHGIEPGAPLESYAATVEAAEQSLRAALEGCPGIEFENKRFSLSIHYRKSRRKAESRAAIDQAVSRLPVPMRSLPGKLVVSLLPAGAPNKGDALVRLREQAGTDTALFVGDDLTDEDIFALDQPGRLQSIRVGASRQSSARYFLRSQAEIDELLEKLLLYRVKAAAR
jgi:trehalose 6-phosphate phosphatase